MTTQLPAEERIRRYLSLSRRSVHIKRYLGGGTDGDVWETDSKTAIKALQYETGYFNEKDSYLRLRDWGVTEQIDGFWIPSLIDFNDELLIIEMDMMQDPPYIIDFAKVKIDRPPEFSEEILADANVRGLEQFEHHWPEVQALMKTLRATRFIIWTRGPETSLFPTCARSPTRVVQIIRCS